ncbi:MAG: hypothetical protein ACREV2_09535 [Burkholderiales bacterium]
MKSIAVALALASPLALATDDTKRTTDRPGASEDAPDGKAKTVT